MDHDRISFFECFFQIAMISSVVSPPEVSRRVHEGCGRICSGCVWKTAGTEAKAAGLRLTVFDSYPFGRFVRPCAAVRPVVSADFAVGGAQCCFNRQGL